LGFERVYRSLEEAVGRCLFGPAFALEAICVVSRAKEFTCNFGSKEPSQLGISVEVFGIDR
jgi:hypothetical protein